MYGIELLVEEHDNILRFNRVVRNMCIRLMNGEEPDIEDFQKVIDFGKNYADKQHHGKEEKILFSIMMDKLGGVAEKLIRNGMYVEHDLGRLHVSQLIDALEAYQKQPSEDGKLDILMNASGYTGLLNRHIEKENEVVYTFAERSLEPEVREEVDHLTEAFEKEAEQNHIQEKYLSMLKELEDKYL